MVCLVLLLLVSIGFNGCMTQWYFPDVVRTTTEDYPDNDRTNSSLPSTLENTRELLTNTTADPLSLCGDWQQIGLKCYKIVNLLINKSGASEKCTQLDKSSTLVQIRSSEEQRAVKNMVYEFGRKSAVVRYGSGKRALTNSSMVSNVWLGLRSQCYSGSQCYYSGGNYRFEWQTGNTMVTYSNWDEDSPDTMARNLCVQMNIETGKWSDVKCTKKNLVVCEKTRQLTMDSLYSALRNAYMNLRAQVIDQGKRVKQQETLIKSLVEEMATSKSGENITNVID